MRHLANRLRPAAAPLDVDDLVSAGTIGLIEAVDRYDPTRGVTFASFAYRRIRGAMIDEISRLGPSGGSHNGGHDALSLEAPVTGGPSSTLMEVTVDRSVSEPQRGAELRELLRAVGELPDRDRQMLGLSVAGHSVTDIAELYGCSSSLVSRILIHARFRLENRTTA